MIYHSLSFWFWTGNQNKSGQSHNVQQLEDRVDSVKLHNWMFGHVSSVKSNIVIEHGLHG